MSETQALVETLCFVSLVLTEALAHRSGTIARLLRENQRLREWQGAQSKMPKLGPHRSCDPCMSPDHLHFDGARAMEYILAEPHSEGEQCSVCGMPHLFCDCGRPTQTTVPSGGRMRDA